MRTTIGWTVAGVLSVLLTIAGCSDDDGGGSPAPSPDASKDAGSDDPSVESGAEAGPDSDTDAAVVPFHARFETPDGSSAVAFLSVPFPSDAYVEADGTLVDDYPGIERFILKAAQASSFSQQLGDSLGFGTSAGSLFELMPDGPSVDPASVPSTEETCGKPGSGAFLLDLSESDPAAMLIPCEALWHDERVWNPTSKIPPTLMVKPARGIKLVEGHRIAALVTTAIRNSSGDPLQASADFAAIRDADSRTTPFEQTYGAAIDQIAQAAVPGLDDVTAISAMTLYDVGTPTQDMLAARDAVMAEPLPALSWDAADVAPMGTGRFNAGSTVLGGFDATLDEAMGSPPKTPPSYYLGEVDDPAIRNDDGVAHDAVGGIATGVFEAPNLLRYGDGTHADPTESTFHREGGAPAIDPNRPTSKVWVTVAIPSTPPPPNGYPVIVFVHGISKDRFDMLSGINDWAAMGFATVAIDLVVQGARAPMNPPGYSVDETNQLQGTYAGPDGFPDKKAASTPMLGSLVGISGFRDHLRQSALDLATLLRVIDSDPDLGPLEQLHPNVGLDAANVQMMAVSLGGMVGVTAAAISPSVRNVVFNASGVSIGHEILPGDGWDGSVLSLGFLAGWGTNVHLDRGNPFAALIGHVIDPADPITFAPYLRDPLTIDGAPAPVRNVLSISVVDDEMVWNGANDAMARAIGLALATPADEASVELPEAEATGDVYVDVPVAGGTALYVRQSPGCHAGNFYGPTCEMTFEWPFPRFEDAERFPKLDQPFENAMPYFMAHEMVGSFFQTGATGVPAVSGYQHVPADYDADGVANASDTDPSNPTVQ